MLFLRNSLRSLLKPFSKKIKSCNEIQICQSDERVNLMAIIGRGGKMLIKVIILIISPLLFVEFSICLIGFEMLIKSIVLRKKA